MLLNCDKTDHEAHRYKEQSYENVLNEQINFG